MVIEAKGDFQPGLMYLCIALKMMAMSLSIENGSSDSLGCTLSILVDLDKICI